jgi:serine/threonine protein kinase
MPLSVGDKLGPYEILAPIGAGGMGELWKARDTGLNRVVAIKRLKGEHTARFQQDARAVAALNHPHICQLYDIGPDHLVLEYVEGDAPTPHEFDLLSVSNLGQTPGEIAQLRPLGTPLDLRLALIRSLLT